MQIRIAQFLLLLFLVQNTQLDEVVKAPLLIQHYIQHKTLHPDTTVYGFLKMHYWDKTVVDADYAQDMQLPFKTIDSHFLSVQLYMPPGFINIKTTLPPFLKEKIINLPVNFPFSIISKIFQPPQFA